MSGGFSALISSLETRYDYVSARVVAKEALKSLGLEESASYDAKQLQGIVDAISSRGDELGSVWSALGLAPSGSPAPAPAPAAPAAADAGEEKKPAAKKDKEDGGAKAKPKAAAKDKPKKKPAAKKKAKKK